MARYKTTSPQSYSWKQRSRAAERHDRFRKIEEWRRIRNAMQDSRRKEAQS